MIHRERMENCLAGGTLDRPPVALWRHFPVDDQRADRLAAAAAQFQHTFDFDFVKVTPASSFCVRDWGAQDEWRGASEGTRDYVNRVIQRPEDWAELTVLDPTAGALGAQLECLRLLVKELGPAVPVVQTIFSPLTQAKNLSGEAALRVHLRTDPEAVRAGLDVIRESTLRFVEAAIDTGIDGLFYAVQHAQYQVLSVPEYRSFGVPDDLEILHAASDLWLNVLHLHGEAIMFSVFRDYPVQIINWHDQETPPSLAEAQQQFDGVVCGGIERLQTMVLGTPEDVEREARAAFDSTEGRRFVLGTGCVTPITAPYGNIMAARRSVESQPAFP